MKRVLGGAASAALGLALLATTAPPATAVQAPHDTQVSAVPPATTPHVLDGDVMAIADVGDVVVLGGRFTQARNPADGSPVQLRTNLLAFDRATGELLPSFAPVVNDTVRSVVAAPDGRSVYVGGQFGQIDGAPAYKLVMLDAHTGQRVPGFNPPIFSAAVMDLDLVGSRLFVAGQFTTVGGQPRQYLAELDPATGALRPGVNSTFGDVVWGGSPHVHKIDVTADGSRMAVLGNFRTVDGQTRVQVALLDLTTSPASLTSWRTSRFEIKCGSSSNTKFDVRDVDFSPDGGYFVIAATGGHPPQGALCDGVTRWETAAAGAGQEPTWYAPTGGDSVYSVATTGAAVYAGGHFRWFNNPVYVQSFKGPGAVDREGIAALDPANGVPLSWNPGRDRGTAVWDFLGTDDGLWVGSDTDRIARYLYRGRIAYFPLDGGVPVPQPAAPELPVRVHLAGTSAAPNGVVARHYDGATAGAATPMNGAGSGWSSARGVFVAGDKVYTARSNGSFTVRSYDGEAFGAEQSVNLNGLTAFSNEAQSMTGGFYENGHVYFTISGSNALFKRGLSAESNIVGAARTTVVGGIPGIDWRLVRGLFLAGDHLYWVRSSTGELHRVDWVAGRPVAGTDAIVSGPGVDGINWSSVALFATQAPANPTADIGVACASLRCEFDGSGSGVTGGSIASYDWDFGDGGTSTEVGPVHHYDSAGTYTVALSVTSDARITASTTVDVTVEAPPAASVAFVGVAANTTQTSALTRSMTLPSSVQEGDSLLLFLSSNSGTATASDPSGWTRRGSASTTGATTIVWSRAATAADAGTPVTVTTSAFVKADLVVGVYRGADLASSTVLIAPETASTAAHTTPNVAAGVEGSWLVSYWADKSGTTTTWNAPSGTVVRHVAAGTGAGHISELLADSGGAVPIGPAGGLTATTNAPQANAAMASVLLAPAG
jgi:PKD repeat protein